MGIYFIYNLIQCIHTKIFGIRQDKLWRIALCYISANAVAYTVYISFFFLPLKKTNREQKRDGLLLLDAESMLVPTEHHSPIFKGHTITFMLCLLEISFIIKGGEELVFG